tara:strand:- start:78 stop:944 length:867 start_codon:yes stop_codon:yes gene_type:complete
MGYLNNTTRTLDAILTKRGREILAGDTGTDERSGFNITQFALGDDEIDYGLWDTTHTRGTDYYGAVIENLPSLEPFNDPSEIMKYKLVTRPEGTKNMPFIRKSATVFNLSDISVPFNPDEVYQVNIPNGGTIKVGQPVDLGSWSTFIDTVGTPIPEEWAAKISTQGILTEDYTVTLLDVSVGILGPNIMTTGGGHDADKFTTAFWAPKSGKFLAEQKNFSQTLSSVSWVNDMLEVTGGGGSANSLRIYPKQTHTRYELLSPIKTKLIVTGETSGAVKEVNVNIYYTTT